MQQRRCTNMKAFRLAMLGLRLIKEIESVGSLRSQHRAGGGGFPPSLWSLLRQPLWQSQRVLRAPGPVRGSKLWQGRPNISFLDSVLLLVYAFPKWPFSGCVSLQGEGVAYRGRILVELSTKLDQKAEKAVDDIHSDDILVVQVLRRFV